MTIEALVERNRQLERAVQRWRLISLLLALLLICSVAIGGTSVGMLLMREDDVGFVLPWNRARQEEELAKQRAVRTFLEDDLLRQHEHRAADEAAKKEPGPP
jgi:hypothetical protein